jgi:hypothetical protein
MRFNIYLDDELDRQMMLRAKQTGQSRHALIRQILTDWLQQPLSSSPPLPWPIEILTFTGVPDFEGFESYRAELLPPSEDPFA